MLKNIDIENEEKDFITMSDLGNHIECPFCPQKDAKISDLEDKLVERDKEISQLKINLGMFKSVNQFLNEYGFEKARKVLLSTESQKINDKVEFAIQQLERVKDFIEHNKSSFWCSYSCSFVDYFSTNDLKLFNFVGQIIEELNKTKKD